MRILRAAFFLSVIAVLAPSPPESEVEKALAESKIVPADFELLAAAGNTVSDLGQFCLRQSEVCLTANYMAARIEAKAKYSARLLYEWASDTSTGEMARLPAADQAEADQLTTGSTVKIASSEGRGTLKPEDRLPDWRGQKI